MDCSSDKMEPAVLRRSSRRSVAPKKSYKVDISSDDEIESDIEQKAPPTKKVRKPLKAKNLDDDDFVPEEPAIPGVKVSRKRKSVVEKKEKVVLEMKPRKAKANANIVQTNSLDSGFVDSNNNHTDQPMPGSSKKMAPVKKTILLKTPPNNNDVNNNSNANVDDDSDEDEDGWEDECEIPEAVDLENYQPELPSVLRIDMAPKKKCKQPGDWVNAWIQQNINKMRKAAHLDAHKVHLLTFIARLRYLNNICNHEVVKALAFSLIPDKIVMKALPKTLERFENFFFDTFSVAIKPKTLNKAFDLVTVMDTFQSFKIDSQVTLNVLLVAFLRAIGLTARLVYFLNPISVKCPNLLSKLNSKKKEQKGSVKENKGRKKAKKAESEDEEGEDWESDSDDSGSEKQAKKKKAKNRTPKIVNRSKYFIKEEDKEEESEVSKPRAIRYWIEIYDSLKKVWQVFESEHNHVSKDEIVKELPDEIRYILAIDNEGFISEVTARYAEDWFSHQMRTRRLDDVDWWSETLMKVGRSNPSELEVADALEFAELLKSVPLPKTVGEYKNHQLFMLEKHVLKFQAIYPRDSKIVGYFRNEPVYRRDCVHTLRSRETWLRRAKSVRIGEIPYKTVLSSFRVNPDTGRKEDLELFGEWQTEDYVPPVAKNGIVPRNAYNNVELFMDCMLPVGTVHIRLPGLARIASKLNIDAVPAIVGFDTGKGGRKGSHPVTDGFVVCEEFEETLRAAWAEEQVHIQRRQEERRLQRIYGNWKKLIKGLLIRQRLKGRFVDDV